MSDSLRRVFLSSDVCDIVNRFLKLPFVPLSGCIAVNNNIIVVLGSLLQAS